MARSVPVKTALVGLLFAPGAMAQQAPDQNAQAPDPTLPPTENKPADPNAAPATMQTVTVTGSRPSDDFQVTRGSINRMGAAELMDVPQTVVVINRALMQSQGATTMENALRNVPGVTIGSAEGGTIGTNINLNGFSARTDIYLDGMRDRGQYYRDVFALEQIEVLMGPSSMLFGRGSTGGVINQVTKKPFLKNATELSVQATTNGLVRSTADVNVPFGQDSTNAARVSAMFQVGKASTLDQTNVLDFGFAPSVKLGIGTPTEITLSAILQHRKDQVPYGVPNLNGFPINVPRNTAYGYDSDATVQDVIQLNSTIDHKFDTNLSLRNQTEFVWVNTAVQETSGGFVGTLAANGGFVQAAPGPGNTPYSAAPLNQLYIRQLSRDRNINDYTLENQTEVTAKFDTAFVGHTLLMGVDLNYEAYTNKTFTRTGTCNGIPLVAGSPGCVAAGFTTGGNTPSNVPSLPGNYASSQAWGFGMYANDTVAGAALAEARRRRALGRLFGADRQFDQFGQHARQYDGGILVADRLLHQRSHRRDHRADARAILLLLLQHVVQSVARAAHRDDGYDRPPAGDERGLRGRRQIRVAERQPLAQWRAVPDHQDERTHGERRRHLHAHGHGPRSGSPCRLCRTDHSQLAGVRWLRLPERPHHQRPPGRQRRRRHHRQRAAQHAQGLGQHLDDLHVQRNLRDRRRRLLCRPALRQQPEYGAGAGVHARRPDRGVQAAEVRGSLQRPQRVQHDVLRFADGVGRRSRRPGLGHDGPGHA